MDEYAKFVPCPEGCKVVYKSSKWLGARKGEDSDAYYFDVVNEAGEVVSSHEVRHATSTFPPFGSRTFLYQ